MNENEINLCGYPYYTNIASISDIGVLSNKISGIRCDYNDKISVIENENRELEQKVRYLENTCIFLEHEVKELRKINANVSTNLYTLLGELQKMKFYENKKN